MLSQTFNSSNACWHPSVHSNLTSFLSNLVMGRVLLAWERINSLNRHTCPKSLAMPLTVVVASSFLSPQFCPDPVLFLSHSPYNPLTFLSTMLNTSYQKYYHKIQLNIIFIVFIFIILQVMILCLFFFHTQLKKILIIKIKFNIIYIIFIIKYKIIKFFIYW